VDKVKVSVNLPGEDIEALEDIAAARHTTKTEALRGAIATERFLREAARNDEQILIRGKDGTMRQLLIR
jgi:hypothetical protein